MNDSYDSMLNERRQTQTAYYVIINVKDKKAKIIDESGSQDSVYFWGGSDWKVTKGELLCILIFIFLDPITHYMNVFYFYF